METPVKLWLAGAAHGDVKKFAGIDLPAALPLILLREPHNAYDKNAISVWVSADWLGKASLPVPDPIPESGMYKLGMIPASRGPNWAAILAPLLDAGGEVLAKLRRVQDGGKMIRITLEGKAVAELPPLTE